MSECLKSNWLVAMSMVMSTVIAGYGGTAMAQVTVNGGAQFSLSDNTTSPFDDAANIVDPSGITVAATSTLGGFPASNLIDGTLGNRWVAGASDATLTFTFDDPVDLGGLLIDWGWADRDNGEFELLIDGVSSIGTFSAASPGSPPQPAAPALDPSFLLFDTVHTDVTSIELDITGSDFNDNGFAEVTFFAGTATVPEPHSIAIWCLLGLSLSGFVLWRRRRIRSVA